MGCRRTFLRSPRHCPPLFVRRGVAGRRLLHHLLFLLLLVVLRGRLLGDLLLGRELLAPLVALDLGRIGDHLSFYFGEDACFDDRLAVARIRVRDDAVRVEDGLPQQPPRRLPFRFRQPRFEIEPDRMVRHARFAIGQRTRDLEERLGLLRFVREGDLEPAFRRPFEPFAVLRDDHHPRDLAEDAELHLLAFGTLHGHRLQEEEVHVPQQAPQHVADERMHRVERLAFRVPEQDHEALLLTIVALAIDVALVLDALGVVLGSH